MKDTAEITARDEVRELSQDEILAVSGGLSPAQGAALTVGLMALAPASAAVMGVGGLALICYAMM